MATILSPVSELGTMSDPFTMLRVQIVDDQALVLKALADLLQSSPGVQVVAYATSITQAIHDAELEHPHVVLLDITDEDDFWTNVGELMRRCPETRLVLLDEAPSDMHVREALRLGVTGYLTKQQPFTQIESALRQAARGERVFVPEIARRLALSADGVRLLVVEGDSPLSALTPREIDVLIHLAKGNSVKQCARILGIGVSTVGNHKSRLMKKLDIHKTVELSRLAMREGLVPAGKPAASRPLPVRDFENSH